MPEIAVLLCTCDRPQRLALLLAALLPQAEELDACVVIVDNGLRSSEQVVRDVMPPGRFTYRRLNERGLVVARNCALQLAMDHKPVLLAFIDDDEVPDRHWLHNLRRRMDEAQADMVNGPVMPDFMEAPPPWAGAGSFYEKSGHTPCTSNLMLRASCLPDDPAQWFLPAFNFSGGEDNEFLNRLLQRGAARAVAGDAIVREAIPADRLRRRYVWQRGLRDGVVISEIAALSHQSRLRFFRHVAWRAVQKLGYACNHLFWSPAEPWRLISAGADLAAACGIVLRASGMRFHFHGPRPAPRQHADQASR